MRIPEVSIVGGFIQQKTSFPDYFERKVKTTLTIYINGIEVFRLNFLNMEFKIKNPHDLFMFPK